MFEPVRGATVRTMFPKIYQVWPLAIICFCSRHAYILHNYEKYLKNIRGKVQRLLKKFLINI